MIAWFIVITYFIIDTGYLCHHFIVARGLSILFIQN